MLFIDNEILSGKNDIRQYVISLLPNLKLSKAEMHDILESIFNKHGFSISKKEVLLEVVKFLDKRPLFIRNLVRLEEGIYRTMEGNADEMIIVGKLIKMGFNCSRVDVTNSKYDAVIDKDGKLLRIQIKATRSDTLDLTCGARSGRQISRDVPSRQRKLTENDCDILIGASKYSAICYIIPAKDLKLYGKNVTFGKIKKYKENWSNIS